MKKQTDFETFFAQAPRLNTSRGLIKGVICDMRVEDIKEPTMREIRYLDKLVDELARGKAIKNSAGITSFAPYAAILNRFLRPRSSGVCLVGSPPYYEVYVYCHSDQQ